MPVFILNDENVVNSYGFKIKTEGINLERFDKNPVMLDGHNPSNLSVIGRWKNMKKENGNLTAEFEFDLEDENAKIISGKVERGIIKGVSMGISFSKKDMKLKDGALVLTKCELLEASIVSIPSNSGALKLSMDGKPISENEIKNLCLSFQKEEEIKNNQNMKLSIAALTALGLSLSSNETTESEIEKAILGLFERNKELEAQNQLSEEKLSAYMKKEEELKLKAVHDLVDEAIAKGKISYNNRADFIELANQNFVLAKATLGAIPEKKSFIAGIKTPLGNSGVLTMEDFQKLSLEEQLAFKHGNPEVYQAILKTV